MYTQFDCHKYTAFTIDITCFVIMLQFKRVHCLHNSENYKENYKLNHSLTLQIQHNNQPSISVIKKGQKNTLECFAYSRPQGVVLYS